MNEQSPIASALWTLLNIGMGAVALIGGSTFLVDLWKHRKGIAEGEPTRARKEPEP